MFDDFEEKILTCGYFVVVDWQKDQVKLKSIETKHYWIMKKFDKEGYPGLVLYHSHDGRSYHVHFCYKDQEIAPAVSEIMSHDRYQKIYIWLRNKLVEEGTSGSFL